MSTHNEPDRPLQNLDGDLRLGKPLGRGSAGTVVEGFQIGLQREVAVKRLHALSGRVDHRRFATESEVLARVAHPNIVPVLCHGLLDGIPVLVMERVDGCDLAHVIRSMGEAATPGGLDALGRALPSSDLPWPVGTPWWKVAASIIAQLARALDHAHRCGVIHHDLKPSNILLSREGRALLCDFGVAEEQGPAGESQVSVSSTSGNVAYSAPEEIQGKGSTHVSDLYSLGVIARELVSLSSAYGDSTGQAPRISAIDQGLLSPLDRKLPKDLKAVLSHATAMEPGNRYRTSGDFARDLEAVIEGRAISIRPDGWIRVTRRWLRQNTKAAGLVLVFIALLVAVPTAFQYARLNQALRIQEANQIAGQHLSFALRGIESMLVHLGSDGLKGQPRLDLARAELLESGSQLCERLHSTLTSQDSAEFREQISRVQAKAWIGLVAVYSRVGDLERADHFLARLDAMEASPSANLAARIQYTRMLLAHSRGDFEAIEAMGPNLIAQLAQQADDDAPLALRRSGIWAALMESAIASGDPQLGVERGLEATRALRNWIELAPEPSMAQRELARVLGNHAAALIESGRTDQGEEASLESNAILEKLPSAPLIQILTATNWNNLGSIARNRENFAAAERMERKALELQEQALAHLPSHVHLRFHADRSRYRVALSMRLQNKTGGDAHGLLTDACAGLSSLCDLPTSHWDHHSTLSSAASDLGKIELGRKNWDAAYAAYDLAARACEAAETLRPGHPIMAAARLDTWNRRTSLALNQEPENAQQALDLFRSTFPENATVARNCASLLCVLSSRTRKGRIPGGSDPEAKAEHFESQALDYLQEAADQNGLTYQLLTTNKSWHPLHQHPRFLALMEQLKPGQ